MSWFRRSKPATPASPDDASAQPMLGQSGEAMAASQPMAALQPVALPMAEPTQASEPMPMAEPVAEPVALPLAEPVAEPVGEQPMAMERAMEPAPFAATMMDYPLTVQHIFERSTRYFANREIVTLTADGAERTTYGALGKRVGRLASALAGLGVRKGDRVATLAWNTARHFELYLAVPCMGATLHTLNLRLAADQLCYIIRDAGDTVLFVDADLAPMLEKAAASQGGLGAVRQVVVMNGVAPEKSDALPELLDYETLLAGGREDYAWPTLDERDPCAMCYTSGTTGNPKGVVYSHRSTFLHAVSTTQVDTIALSGRDVTMPLVPMFHVNAWGLPHAAALVGARLVFPGRFMDPTRVAQAIVDEQVTLAAGVPTIWIGLMQVLAKRPDLDMSHVTRFLCGGSAAPRALIEAMEARGLNLLHAWGMTETSPIGTVAQLKPELEQLPVEEQISYRAKQGVPVAGIELRVIDLNTGAEVPRDGTTFGEIQVRGPWVAGSYYVSAGAEAEDGEPKWVDGWFRTGDVATIDAEGYVQIVDRTKDVIKSGGEWVSSVLLEGIIMGHPQVLEAAVVGMPHPKWQERPVAAVVLKPDAEALTQEEIRQYLEPQVAKWWLPDAVVFVPALPKTGTGKFDKRALRTQLADQVHLS